MSEYIIGGTKLILNKGGLNLEEDEFISLFQNRGGSTKDGAPICYDLIPAELKMYSQSPMLLHNGTFELRETEKGVLMVCHWAACRFAYGFFVEELGEGDTVRCYYSPKLMEQISMNVTRFFSTVGLHSKFLQRDAVILHASYVERDGEAILFAGHSGAGKSTQAALWEQTGRGRTINGDRVLLRQVDGRWHAFGYPCCGSSKICLNETLPVKAIVLLQKGTESRVIATPFAANLRALLLGIQVFSWQREETDLAYALAQKLTEQVPILTLSATPDLQAVSVLDGYLAKVQDFSGRHFTL